VKKFLFELTSVPSVPKNITYFQVFEDDKHILDFLISSRVFQAQVIDEGEQQQAQFEIDEIMNLRTNTIPKGMIELKRIFDADRLTSLACQSIEGGECEKINLGMRENIKNVFIGKVCTPTEKEEILNLMKQFPYMISWGYEDLKTYDTSLITHTIPLKPKSKPFRQRQRPIDPLLEPLIHQEVKKLLSARIIFPV
jgi:hypothetical protein